MASTTTTSREPHFNHQELNKAAEWAKFEAQTMEHLESHCLKSQLVSRVVDGYQVHKPSKGEQRSTWLFHNKKVQVLLSTYPEVMDQDSRDAEGNHISLETIVGINHARELYVARAQTELYIVMKNNFSGTHKQILSKYSPERNVPDKDLSILSGQPGALPVIGNGGAGSVPSLCKPVHSSDAGWEAKDPDERWPYGTYAFLEIRESFAGRK